MTSLRVFTGMHLSTAKRMPRKAHPLWLGDEKDKAYRRRAKRERKAIAQYYRLLRSAGHEEYPGTGHRYGIVTTGTEARVRIKHLQN